MHNNDDIRVIFAPIPFPLMRINLCNLTSKVESRKETPRCIILFWQCRDFDCFVSVQLNTLTVFKNGTITLNDGFLPMSKMRLYSFSPY